MPESEYSVSINAEGHQEKFITLYVHSGSQIDTTIYLDEVYTNIIHGIVSDNNGQTISNAEVRQLEIDNTPLQIFK